MSTLILIIGSVIPNIRGSVLKPCTAYMQRAGYNVCSLPSDFTNCIPNVYALTKVEC